MNNNNKNHRKELFMHLDGITIIPTIIALEKLGIVEFIKKNNSFIINDIIEKFEVSEGYLNIAMRSLLSLDILRIDFSQEYSNNKVYTVVQKKIDFIKNFINSEDYIRLISVHIKLENIINNYAIINSSELNSINTIIGTIKNLQLEKSDFKSQFNYNFYYYVEGILVGPILSNLGFLKKTFKEIEYKPLYELIIKIFILCKFIDNKLEITNRGEFFYKRMSSYGVTTSYLNLLKNLDELINKKNNLVWQRDNNGNEIHVNRSMNVWGSGGAHKFYFKKIDTIIKDTFNKKIEDQPKGIIDMGCGDGTFLKHCYDIIINETLRSKYINEFPLKLIGVDINKAARISSRNTLNKSNIDNIVINGNISDPDDLNKRLINEFNENLNDFISTRTFLDHNRIYIKPNEIKNYNIKTTGAFCYKGNLINSSQIINNLINHLYAWKKHVEKHGLIILELHTIKPNSIKKNRGTTLSLSYDTTHGFSDQYLIEYDAFIECAKYAGLKLSTESILYPNLEIPTISINYFK